MSKKGFVVEVIDPTQPGATFYVGSRMGVPVLVADMEEALVRDTKVSAEVFRKTADSLKHSGRRLSIVPYVEQVAA